MWPLALVTNKSLDSAFNSILDELFSTTETSNFHGFKLKDNVYNYTLAMPGFESSQLHLEVADGKLFITAESTEEDNKQKYQYWLHLPKDGNSDAIDATLKNGLLKIKLPRKEEAKPKKIIVN